MLFKGLAYRAHNPYWSFSPTSGDGAKLHGGRFNPKGTPALYLSLSAPIALAEFNQGFPHRPQPATLCTYEIDYELIFNLLDKKDREQAKITLSEMACEWELIIAKKEIPPTWDMAARLISAGIAGIMVPSYAKNSPAGGSNLVLWDWQDHPPRQVKLIDDDNRLPKNQDSWK